MLTATGYPHIETPIGESPRIKRMPRFRVSQIVMSYLVHGWSPDEICRQYPVLMPAEVHSAMTYYHDNRDAIEREIDDELELLKKLDEESAPSALQIRLRALKRA